MYVMGYPAKTSTRDLSDALGKYRSAIPVVLLAKPHAWLQRADMHDKAAASQVLATTVTWSNTILCLAAIHRAGLTNLPSSIEHSGTSFC